MTRGSQPHLTVQISNASPQVGSVISFANGSDLPSLIWVNT